MEKNHSFPFSLPFILDGATGTELTRRGMNSSDCTERFILDHPDILQQLQREYLQAGSSAVLAPTFGANRPTLKRHGFAEDQVRDVCRTLFKIARDNAGDAKIGGDMSPTGLMLKPYGDAEPQTVYDIYREQAQALLDCGVDFFFIETMISAAEARLAVQAVRSLSKDIPVFVSLTVGESGRTMSGDRLDAALWTLLPLDIQAFGCNCSIGPDVIYRALAPAAPIAKKYGIPLIAKPNAGMPVTDESGTRYPLSPQDMADAVDSLAALGVGIFGGCCGSTPAHVQAIAQAARATAKERFSDVEVIACGDVAATSRTWAAVDPDAEYLPVDGDSEEAIYDLMDEHEAEEVLYLELHEGAADLLIDLEGTLTNPIAVRGNPAEIEKLEKTLCRKVR